MILDSTNGTTFYVTEKPDWSKPYAFDFDFFTTITKSKDGSEQRAQQRAKPRYTINYQIAGMTTAEFSVRKAVAIRALGGLIAIPVWHAWRALSSVVSDQVNILNVAGVAAMTVTQFKTGGLAYFEETGLTSVFRRIASVGSVTVLNMLAGDCESPAIAMPAYTNACRVYPVIVGIADQNSHKFIPIDPFTTAQMFDVMEL
jgi:hypothetical protein